MGPFGIQRRGVEDQLHHTRAIVDERERRHRTWGDPEMRVEPFGAGEGQPGRPDQPGQGLEVEPPVLQGHDQPQRALLVFQEQGFEMRPGHFAAQLPAFLDREDRAVPAGLGLDPELGEQREQRLLARRQPVRAIVARTVHPRTIGGAARAGNAEVGLAAPAPI